MSTHNIQFNDKKIFLNIVFLSYRKKFVETQNEFELAMVNEPSVFELLRFDCIGQQILEHLLLSVCLFKLLRDKTRLFKHKKFTSKNKISR